MRIKINKIRVKPGRRAMLFEHIEELSKSIAEVGLLNPITVDQDYTLIAGLHRLEAVKRLGWAEVECAITSLEGLQAELAELDENFVRSDFSAVEFGDLLLRRKEIYEALHPDTKNGGDRMSEQSRTRRARSASDKSFVADTADKTGLSRRTIEEKIQVARDLVPEMRSYIQDQEIGFKNALKICRLPEDQQRELAAMLADGTIKSAEEYHSTHSNRKQSAAVTESTSQPSDTSVASGPLSSDTEECLGQEIAIQSSQNPPFVLGGKRFLTFQESVADLKDPNKDCRCTPDSFLAEITEFVKKFHKEIEWFNFSYYETAILNLSQVQREYFQAQLNSVHAAVEALCDQVMKGRVLNGQKK